MSVLDKRLILVAGKGGVGRSTVAAALGLASAARGRKTLLYESSANDRWSELFGGPAVGTDIVELRPKLHAVNTSPAEALREYGLMVLRFERVYRMVFENRVTKYFLRAIPGLDDYAVLGKAWYHTTEMQRSQPLWDTLVFDLPASGHAMSMLRIPSVILDTVPEGPLTRDARKLRSLLVDPERTALVLVTLAEEMPANEAREFAAQVTEQLRIPVAHVIVNQVYPNWYPAGSPAAKMLDALAGAGIDPDVMALREHGEFARNRRELNEHYLDLLDDTLSSPKTRLPLLFAPELRFEHIQALSEQLAHSLG